MAKGCRCKVAGGTRCGLPLIDGKKYCTMHVPKKVIKLPTYAIGETRFDGEKKVKASQYDFYLQSTEWLEKAKREKESNPNCALCNRKGILHVHHRTYVRCGKEKSGDLVVLCSHCHDLFHKFYKYDGRVGHFVPA